MKDILIVDDEADIRDLISGILEDEGYEARTAGDADTALREIAMRKPSLVLLDIWLKGSRLDGLQVLQEVKRNTPDVPVIIISGHGNIEVAVSAIRAGAYDFIEKPLKIDQLLLIISRALEAARLKREVAELRLRSGQSDVLVGDSSATQALRGLIDKIAPTGSRILVSGPAGSGKETVARMIHAGSRRAGGGFIAINAASIAPDRMESELFGVEAQEGQSRKIGVFEQAHGGTLFLDEVGDMPPETQNKILRVLVDQTFHRVNGVEPVRVDVRVISATSRDLSKEIAAGRFREDLFHRLNVVPVRIPSLAERREDIPVLVRHFGRTLAESAGFPQREVSDDAMALLQSYDWPGNVRQLRNVVERLLILTRGEQGPITAEAIPQDIVDAAPAVLRGNGTEQLMSLPLREARERFERDYLVAQITRFNGNISRTASFIGMERSALHRKLKMLGISSEARGGEAGD
ncbi:MAG: sigma-54 dependent transcriptional regulator [Alphaproteobacteria bacterium]|nr:sigma-54 dependent transcriptional regulator [Alphaproteobacteria bacterium]MDX5370280.1 sigma-54 dependent transcriptional regulator [Alphaproteobacteria bacterium]MDX5464822.1 sigma-54 dependent transcriptional regulator [Alphaproteobacteria bacterium]